MEKVTEDKPLYTYAFYPEEHEVFPGLHLVKISGPGIGSHSTDFLLHSESAAAALCRALHRAHSSGRERQRAIFRAAIGVRNGTETY